MAQYDDNATVRLAFPPLRVFPEDPAIEIFCTGLVMDVVTDLSRFRSFRVLSDDPTTFRDGPDRSEADRHLDYTVRGLAHYHEESLQITLQLHSLRENRLVWGEKFGGPLQELFRIQEEIVEKREEGGVWMMTFESVRAQVRDLKGLHDIARLCRLRCSPRITNNQ